MKRILVTGMACALWALTGAAAVTWQEPNYDESKVAPYALEDPLTFVDGRKVRTAADLAERRREILGIFAREMYGRAKSARHDR